MNQTAFLILLTSHLAKSKKERILIAGRTAGLDMLQTIAHFKATEGFLENSGYHVINPCDFIDFEEHWLKIRRSGILLLTQCNYLYMLKNWECDVEAKILFELAQNIGVNIILE